MPVVRLLVGTRKGAFVYTSDEKREQWRRSEPMLKGWPIYHMSADIRSERPRLYAAANNAWWGRSIARSDDWGATWEQRTQGLAFPADLGLPIENIWCLEPGAEPGEVYAGTDPAGLFLSEDGGATWHSVDGINRHEFRPFWQPIPGVGLSMMALWAGRGPEAAKEAVLKTGRPGAGNVHSIQIDPRDRARMYVSIGGGGAYRTDDGGLTWGLISLQAVPGTPQARMYVSQNLAGAPPGVDPAANFDMHCLRIDARPRTGSGPRATRACSGRTTAALRGQTSAPACPTSTAFPWL